MQEAAGRRVEQTSGPDLAPGTGDDGDAGDVLVDEDIHQMRLREQTWFQEHPLSSLVFAYSE